jgi:mannose-6-phosphate isomerase-like protein (cupin superfamily)
MQVLPNAGTFTPPAPGEPRHWVEQLRVAALSVGTYSVPVEGADTQQPHTEDEVYVVTAGHARVVADSGSAEVGPGSVIYVPAGEPHRFVDITEDLAVLVIFAPPEQTSGRGRPLVGGRHRPGEAAPTVAGR